MFTFQKRRRDGSLVARINCLEKELLVSSKECLILKDNLQATKEKLISVENTSADNSEVVVVLKAELEESKVSVSHRKIANCFVVEEISCEVRSYSAKKHLACEELENFSVGLLGFNTMWTCM